MKVLLTLTFYGLVWLCLMPGSTLAATVTLNSDHPNSSAYIVVEGEIIVSDVEEFADLLKSHPTIDLLVLSSLGGRVNAAIDIGLLVRASKIKTAVEGVCASSCALIWLAGAEKFVIHQDTRIGFHSPYQGEGKQISSVGNAFVGAYLNSLGYSPNVIAYATIAAPDEMQWLSGEDANKLGLEFKTAESRQELLSRLHAKSEAQSPNRAVSPTIIVAIQEALNRVGCVAGSPDGIWGKRSQAAFNAFVKRTGAHSLNFLPAADILREIQKNEKQICDPSTFVRKPTIQHCVECSRGKSTHRWMQCASSRAELMTSHMGSCRFFTKKR